MCFAAIKDMKILLVFCGFVWGVCYADVSQRQNAGGPYPSSGWQPQGSRLNLPAEYGPPAALNVEVSRENIAFAGQQVAVTTVSSPNNEYLPPTATESQLPQVCCSIRSKWPFSQICLIVRDFRMMDRHSFLPEKSSN